VPFLQDVQLRVVPRRDLHRHAVEQWGEGASAGRFYTWACGLVAARAAAVDRCVRAAEAGRQPAEADLLHTRYALDGSPALPTGPISS